MRKIVRVIFLFFICVSVVSFSKVVRAEESNLGSNNTSESLESSVAPLVPAGNRAVVSSSLSPDKTLINDGDEVTWTLEVLAPTNPAFDDFKLDKNLPASVTYISESTIFNGVSAPDSIVWGSGGPARIGDAIITFKTVITGAPGETVTISIVGSDASVSIFSAEASVTLNGGGSTSDTSSSTSESTSQTLTTETTNSTESISTLESTTPTTATEVVNNTTDTGMTNKKTLPKTGDRENNYLFMLGICLSFVGLFVLFRNYKKIKE